MKKIYLFVLVLFTLTACGPGKKIKERIGKGQYDEAIDLAVRKLQKHRNQKSADEYVLLLEEAFSKAQQRDLEQIERWKKDNRPDKWEKIYDLYVKINLRQEKIRPLLPLRVIRQNREARFDLRDFTDATIDARQHYVAYLYDEALKKMAQNNRTAYREAYNMLEKVNFLQPGYRDTERLMQTALERGTVVVGISIENKTDKVLPRKLMDELLRFDNFASDNFWTRYVSLQGDPKQYDYTGKLIFTDIQVSPEREREKEIIQEKEVVDGYRTVTDTSGRQTKVPVYRKVQARVHLYQQLKEALAKARVEFYDPRTGQLLFNKPLEAHYVFDHRFASYTGDKRALDKEVLEYTQNKRIPFPSNEQMIYDAGMDIKAKFNDILRNAQFP